MPRSNAFSSQTIRARAGAADAVGSLVGQLAKLRGARVIGIAGSDEKVAKLRETYGFDAGINYKTEDVDARLGELAADGITHYHDNVGGPVTAAAFNNMATFGRVSVCGVIEAYTKDKPAVLEHYEMVIMRRLAVQGFLCMDYIAEMEAFQKMIRPLLDARKIQYSVDLRQGGVDAYRAHQCALRGNEQGQAPAAGRQLCWLAVVFIVMTVVGRVW